MAIDPHTGRVLALVGGRNYGMSQLNHALAKRPTGSIFKPFVYAAAMNTALDGGENVFTPVTTVPDVASTSLTAIRFTNPATTKRSTTATSLYVTRSLSL